MREIITIQNAISEISVLHERVESLGTEYDLSEEIISDLKLVMEEAVSNIIFYGFKDGTVHEIIIKLEFSNKFITICLEDQGQPFNPLDYEGKKAGAPLEEYDQGGMGLIIIKELMDEVQYEYQKGKNTLLMIKRITSEL